jgi:hypothetical protein
MVFLEKGFVVSQSRFTQGKKSGQKHDNEFLLKINIKMRREKGISIKDKLYNYIGIKIAEKFFLSWS